MDYHCGCFDMYILHCIDINICSEEKSSRFSFLLIVTSPRLQRLRVWGCYKTLSCRRQIKGVGGRMQNWLSQSTGTTLGL